MGCGKSEEDTTVVAPPPVKAAPAADPLAGGAPPAPTPPPEAAPPPAAGPAAMPVAAAEEPKEFKDPDGKTISLMQHMEALVAGYERQRASNAADPANNPQWPPLTDLNQLVNMRMIARLPKAPDGQKFVYDSQTGKVSLAPK